MPIPPSRRGPVPSSIMALNTQAMRNSFPHASHVAVLLIDVINDMAFEGGERLLKAALPAARRIAALREAAARHGVPVIYVNDNFGQWRSDLHEQVNHVLHDGVPGRPVTELLQPGEDDYFVLKPLHSGFYSTTLDTLLEHLGVRTLVLTGFTTDICVLFTANDAYMRNYDLYVPRDCTAAQDPDEHAHLLAYMERVLKVDTRPAEAIDFEALNARAARRPEEAAPGVSEAAQPPAPAPQPDDR